MMSLEVLLSVSPEVINMTGHPFHDLPLPLTASLSDVDAHRVEAPDSGRAVEVHVP